MPTVLPDEEVAGSNRSPRQCGVSGHRCISRLLGRTRAKRTACHSARPALGEGRMDAIREAGPLVAAVPELSQAADETHSDLHRALSEVLRVAAVCSKTVRTVPDDPTGEMPHRGAGRGRDRSRVPYTSRNGAPLAGNDKDAPRRGRKQISQLHCVKPICA